MSNIEELAAQTHELINVVFMSLKQLQTHLQILQDHIHNEEQKKTKYFIINDQLTTYNSGDLSKTNTGLGNALFQIAVVYGLAKKTNRKMYFNHVHSFCQKLKSQFGFDHEETIYRNCQELAPIPLEKFTHVGEDIVYFRQFEPTLFNRIQAVNGPVRLSGHLEVVEYFKQYRDDILNLFSIDAKSVSYILSKYPELYNPLKCCISIHFRVNNWDQSLDVDYYSNAISTLLFPELLQHTTLFIFSDNLSYTKENYLKNIPIPQEVQIIFMEGNPDYIDLWCMSLCKYNILCRSTFSFWGAYLNKNPDKLHIVPKMGGPFLNHLDKFYAI